LARARRAVAGQPDAADEDTLITASLAPEAVLTHPPRPRKKKRR
jgi:hypothetical protein